MRNLKLFLPVVLAAALVLQSACSSENLTGTIGEPILTLIEVQGIKDNHLEVSAPFNNGVPDPEAGYSWEWKFGSVFIDNVGVLNSSHRLVCEGDTYSIYVSLVPVLMSFGLVDISTKYEAPMLVEHTGINGTITFAIGSKDFNVDCETVTLALPALVFDGAIYVPILFFRDVFGADSAIFYDGKVYISVRSSRSDCN